MTHGDGFAGLVGRSGDDPEVYEVSAAKIREFAAAIGDPHPLYRDAAAARAAGYADVLAPPTFPIVFTAAAEERFLAAAGAAVELSHVLHREQRFAYTRPIVAGSTLRCAVSVADAVIRGEQDVLTTVTQVRTEAGEHVVAVTSTILVRRQP